MARKTTKQAAVVTAEPEIPPFWDFIEGRTGAQGASTAKTPANQPDMAALLARIDGLEANLGEKDAQIARLSQVPASQTANSGYQVNPADLQVSHEGLPDRDADPAGYDRMLTTRINAAMQARDYALRQEYQTRQTQQSATERVWNTFNEKYPEWAGHKKLIGATAQELVADALARGMDAERYMFGTSDVFCDDIVKSLQKDGYGALVEDHGEEEEPATPAARRTMRPGGVSEEEDAGRTGGIMGGTESGGAPTPGKNKGGDFIDDLKAVQSRLGIY